MATAYQPAPLPFIHPDDMPDLYALEGVGTCMEPVVMDGALLTLDKRVSPEIGDTVVLVFTPNYARRYGVPGIVKRLSSALPPPEAWGDGFLTGMIFVEQLNPPKSYTLLTSDVLAVHKCIGFAEADGPGRARFNTTQEAPR